MEAAAGQVPEAQQALRVPLELMAQMGRPDLLARLDLKGLLAPRVPLGLLELTVRPERLGLLGLLELMVPSEPSGLLGLRMESSRAGATVQAR